MVAVFFQHGWHTARTAQETPDWMTKPTEPGQKDVCLVILDVMGPFVTGLFGGPEPGQDHFLDKDQ